MKKEPIDAARVRRVPPRFSWLDHRLVREGYLGRCDALSAKLYLFLVTVGDREGLSYYSDTSLVNHLRFRAGELEHSRAALIDAQLILYRKPLYQVLSLEPVVAVPSKEAHHADIAALVQALAAHARRSP